MGSYVGGFRLMGSLEILLGFSLPLKCNQSLITSSLVLLIDSYESLVLGDGIEYFSPSLTHGYLGLEACFMGLVDENFISSEDEMEFVAKIQVVAFTEIISKGSNDLVSEGFGTCSSKGLLQSLSIYSICLAHREMMGRYYYVLVQSSQHVLLMIRICGGGSTLTVLRKLVMVFCVGIVSSCKSNVAIKTCQLFEISPVKDFEKNLLLWVARADACLVFDIMPQRIFEGFMDSRCDLFTSDYEKWGDKETDRAIGGNVSGHSVFRIAYVHCSWSVTVVVTTDAEDIKWFTTECTFCYRDGSRYLQTKGDMDRAGNGTCAARRAINTCYEGQRITDGGHQMLRSSFSDLHAIVMLVVPREKGLQLGCCTKMLRAWSSWFVNTWSLNVFHSVNGQMIVLVLKMIFLIRNMCYQFGIVLDGLELTLLGVNVNVNDNVNVNVTVTVINHGGVDNGCMSFWYVDFKVDVLRAGNAIQLVPCWFIVVFSEGKRLLFGSYDDVSRVACNPNGNQTIGGKGVGPAHNHAVFEMMEAIFIVNEGLAQLIKRPKEGCHGIFYSCRGRKDDAGDTKMAHQVYDSVDLNGDLEDGLALKLHAALISGVPGLYVETLHNICVIAVGVIGPFKMGLAWIKNDFCMPFGGAVWARLVDASWCAWFLINHVVGAG